MGQESQASTKTQPPEINNGALTDILHGDIQNKGAHETSNDYHQWSPLPVISNWLERRVNRADKKGPPHRNRKAGKDPSDPWRQPHQDEPWLDVNAVRHINQFGTPKAPLMEISCTPDKAYLVRDFITAQGIEEFDAEMNRFIQPYVVESNENDNKKIARRSNIHFVRLLLARWKEAHYIVITGK